MSSTGPWILVVDDDEDIRDIIGLILQSDGYQTLGAADGFEALARLRQASQPPRLIVLDLMMPRMNGAELAKALKSDGALARIPIVIVSGNRGVREAASELGVEGYLVKPVEMDELLRVVHRHVGEPRPLWSGEPSHA